MNFASRLILVKHSMPEKAKGVPIREWNLSEDGRILARKLAVQLRQYQPEVIVSSVEPKAQQTAEIVGENLGLKFVVVGDLHEHDRSQSPFYPDDEFQSLVQELFEKPDALVFGSETANQALTRFRESIHSILKSYNGKNIMVVSHGTVISLFASWLTGNNGYLLWKELVLPSFVVLDMQSKKLLKIQNIT